MRPNKGLTLVDLLVVVLILFMLAVLMLPAQRGARESARRNNCQNQIKQLVLATLNRESATRRFPLAINRALPQNLRSVIDQNGPQPYSDADGYSFLVPLLSYMEHSQLADSITDASENFQHPLNSARFQADPNSQASIWDKPISILLCPSYPGENLARKQNPRFAFPQVSNYHAMVAGCVEGEQQQMADLSPASGGIIVTALTAPNGLAISDITDGTSKTIMLCESREETWSAWFSGASVSTVALPPDEISLSDVMHHSSPAPPVQPAQPTTDSADPSSDDPVWHFSADLPSGINFGRTPNGKGADQPMFWGSKKKPRHWGPSGSHAGDVVMHGYADGHVRALNKEIAAETYFQMSTRGGGGEKSETGE